MANYKLIYDLRILLEDHIRINANCSDKVNEETIYKDSYELCKLEDFSCWCSICFPLNTTYVVTRSMTFIRTIVCKIGTL